MLDLEPIKARLAAATSGPWQARALGRCWVVDGPCADQRDADFIAHAPEDIAALVAKVEELLEAIFDAAYAVKGVRDEQEDGDTWNELESLYHEIKAYYEEQKYGRQ